MSSLLSVLNIAQTGLSASSAALTTVGQNVANANTPGYALRNMKLATTFSGGVQATGVARSSDTFTFTQLTQEQGKKGAADARAQSLSNAQSVLAPTSGGGIKDSVNSFFSAASALSVTPTSTSARTGVIAQAQDVATSISAAAQSIASERDGLLTQAQSVATDANASLQQVAKLNEQIKSTEGSGGDASDMRDQRDVLLNGLATSIGAHSIEDTSGNLLVVAGGTTLVSGNTAASLNVTLDTGGALAISATRSGGNSVQITNNVQTGTLGGIREARDTDLVKTQSDLDQYAYNLATAVNTQHAAGYTATGTTGQKIFTAPTQVAGAAAALTVDTTLLGHPELIAAASSAADASGGNKGALALANLASLPSVGGQTPSAGFGAVAAGLGAAVSSAQSDSDLRASTVSQAQSLHDSITGVSVDEEMVNLTKFQNAYQANSKVLATINTLFDSLLQVVR